MTTPADVPGPPAPPPPGGGNGQHTRPARAAPADQSLRLRLHRNPLRLVFSAAPWLSLGYLGAYLLTGWVLAAVALTAVTTAAVFAITLAGIPLLTAAAGVLRGCANAERARLRPIWREPVRGGYRAVTKPGVVAQATTRWRDPATWRDLAYLLGLWAPLTALDLAVVTVWLTLLAGVTLPIWYWAPRGNAGIGYVNNTTVHGVALGYFPHGPTGPGAVGLYVDTLPKALLAAAGFLVLLLIFNYALVATGKAHALAARALLRKPADPLAPAKDVLARPGPLGPLLPVMPNGGARAHRHR